VQQVPRTTHDAEVPDSFILKLHLQAPVCIVVFCFCNDPIRVVRGDDVECGWPLALGCVREENSLQGFQPRALGDWQFIVFGERQACWIGHINHSFRAASLGRLMNE
jgi:hypothetical protein